jgi:ABC-type uncharacterized transport system permease subunit
MLSCCETPQQFAPTDTKQSIMKTNMQFIVYLVGIAVFGFFHEPVKTALGGQWLFLLFVAGYLMALRLLGAWVGMARARNQRNNGS